MLKFGMIKKNIIKTIGDKEMNRADFLKYSGLSLAAIVGFKTVVNLLTQPEDTKTTNTNESSRQNTKASRGFGGGKYGV